MPFLVIIGLILSANLASASGNLKSLAQGMMAANRAMDLLMAREETKDSLAFPVLRNALNKMSTDSAVDAKVKLLTDEQSLQNCLITHSETKSPDESETVALIEYKGANCPLQMTGKIHVLKTPMGADVEANVALELLSPELKAELDLEKVEIPLTLKMGLAATEEGGFAMDMKMELLGKLHSVSMGLVDLTSTMDSRMVFSATGLNMKTVAKDTFSSSGQKMVFLAISEVANNVQTETYSIDGVLVSKEEFEKQHAAISMPGFEQKPEPLTMAHLCTVRTYDTAQYSLENIRKSIKDNTISSLVIAEELAPILLTQTGRGTQPAFLGLELSISTTADAARFFFEKKGMNGGPNEPLDRITYVLGGNAELTKVILNRVVRITCSPN